MKTKNIVREPIATWYDAVCRWDMVFVPVEVVAFTDKTVTIREKDCQGNYRESRSAIVSEYHHYYPTFEEAKNAIIAGCERKIAAAKEELEEWNTFLVSAKGLTQ